MQFSIPTLQFTDFLVFASAGTIFVCNWLLHRERDAFLLFGVSFLNCAAMSVSFVDFGAYGDVLSTLGWSVAGSLFWAGLRRFDGLPPVTRTMMALLALPTGTHLVLAAAGLQPDTVNLGSTFAYACHEAAIAYYALRQAQAKGPTRLIVGVALAVIPVAICLPLLPVPDRLSQLPVVLLFVSDHVTTIVLTMCILSLEADKAHVALARLARTDALTGALNRQGLAYEVRLQPREAGVIVADLDHFKSINDRFGHAGGDAVLREFTRRAAMVLPADGRIARLGGEEFALLLPGQDINATTFIAERLRNAVACATVAWKETGIPFTVSVGVAMLAAGEALESVFDQADAALYRAKTEGRNRVRVA
ncbi:GGDEF domain-containing protein [Mangrovibrevibacter kandeliae]|uniref:GGDEF domain-containing protein n=1 Tax=Mangrovibrevibacter kandeliae TaxID=2968473 RepID=UPI00211919A0|nr:GGDEF domain-containing protein [Aurantimonas sp. CSK15Z-1]MCQ8782038.1 GGDEF domain-containing protein [Aurantimonas sp. CSK15Z-1]